MFAHQTTHPVRGWTHFLRCAWLKPGLPYQPQGEVVEEVVAPIGGDASKGIGGVYSHLVLAFVEDFGGGADGSGNVLRRLAQEDLALDAQNGGVDNSVVCAWNQSQISRVTTELVQKIKSGN